jgi:AraC-like DNA-binding protein
LPSNYGGSKKALITPSWQGDIWVKLRLQSGILEQVDRNQLRVHISEIQERTMTRLPDFRMTDLHYDVAVLEPPWTVRCLAEPYAQFLLVRRGSCWIDCPSFLPYPFYVAEGGMMVTVGGGTQLWRSGLDAEADGMLNFPTVPLGSFQRDPGDTHKTEILIGRSPRGGNLLVPAFPRAFYLSPQETETHQRMSTMLDLIDSEVHGSSDLIERDGVISRAAEIMTIVLARYVKAKLAQNSPNWPEVATDEQVMRALRLIETHPARGWTVESLASEIGMGRSAFAVRFKSLVGDTPMNCLLRTRMQLASAAIRDGRRSVTAIANSVGYLSEPAFIKAFRRYFGLTPGSYRASAIGGHAGALAAAGEPAADAA